MFFKHVRRNAAKYRKNNGLFFSSLVVAIVAFYTLLSLGDQDVMRFLKTIESDAVSKLMLLVPVVYMISLFFVFFLVYFAYRYQLDNRKKEFGLYLMLGMKRSTLFAMLMS
jgi:putative ABC transport system permease protein